MKNAFARPFWIQILCLARNFDAKGSLREKVKMYGELLARGAIAFGGNAGGKGGHQKLHHCARESVGLEVLVCVIVRNVGELVFVC